jgi:hypothetical protein
MEIDDMGTGRISDDKARGQMNDFRAVCCHFVDGILDVASGAPVAAGVPNELDGHILVPAERPFPVFKRPETFPPAASAIAVTNNDSDFSGFLHVVSFMKNATRSLHIIIPPSTFKT